jgi:hypothetical protein
VFDSPRARFATYDETLVFMQAGVFRLIRYRLVQRGPAFPEASDVTFDDPPPLARWSWGQVTTIAGEMKRVLPRTHPAAFLFE